MRGVVPPVGPGNTSSNAQGQVPPTPNQQGGILSITVPAGATVPYQLQGTFFYNIASSGSFSIRPAGGSFNVYRPGTGYRLPANQSFAFIEIKNDNSFPVALAMFIGFGEFIDNRLILEGSVVQQILKVTYSPTPAVAGPIAIDDISGQPFTDQNGTTWLAIGRVAFYVDNLSLSSNLLIQNDVSSGVVCGIVFPVTTRTVAAAGDFTLKNGLAAVQAAVVEIYNAIEPNIPL